MRSFSLLIALFTLFLAHGCVTQSGLSKDVYYIDKYRNRVDPGNTIFTAWATYSVEQTPDMYYIKKEYYYDTGQKISETRYTDKSLKVADGKAAVWYDNGSKWSEGNYKNGKKEGEWKYYSSSQNGKLSSYGIYSNDLKEGLWTGVDSLGNKSDETLYKAGKEAGETKYFNPDGTVRTDLPKTLFDDGGLDVQVPPSFPCNPKLDAKQSDCGERSLMNYLATNIKYPAKAREEGITGTAIMQFVVDKDGSIINVTPVRGICDDIKAECIRIVKNMPKWEPGMANGQPVKVRYTLPIRFRLE